MAALDPRTKIVMVIAVSTASMTIDDIWYQFGILIALSAVMALGGIGLGKQLRQAKAAIGIVVFLFILQAVFGRWILGAMLCLRLMIVIMSALILLTGETRDYLLGLIQMKIPYEIAYMVMIGIHFFPILKEEAMDVYYSIQLRGTEVKKAGIMKKLRIYMKISMPVLTGAMRRARDMSVSMETRRYRAMNKRTYLRKLKLAPRDKVTMIIMPLICVALIFTGCTDFGTRGADAAQSPKAKASQITLSWSGSAKTTQDISWKGSGDAMYVKYTPVRNYEMTGKWTSFTKGEKTSILNGRYYRYSACVTKLTAGTKYYYTIGAGHKWTEKKTFTTAARSGDFSFMSLGDIQFVSRDRDYEKWGDDISAAYKREPGIKFSLQMGDLINGNADLRDWNACLENASSVFGQIPIMTTAGNHETSIIPKVYLQMMSLPKNGPEGLEEEVYSFDYGDCHFVSVNSNLLADERRDDMGKSKWNSMVRKVDAWLKDDLSSTKAKWKIVYMHHPAYPASDDGNPIYKRIRTNWSPVFAETGVDLVLCGHQHVYMRTKPIDGVTYMIADSGYKPSHYYHSGDPVPSYVKKLLTYENTYEIYDVTAGSLKVTAYKMNGKAVDSVTFSDSSNGGK